VLGGLLGGVPIDAQQEFVGDLGDLLAPYALATGVTLTLLCLLHGAVYLSLRTAGAALHARARRAARSVAPVTALAVLGFCTWTRVVAGNVTELQRTPGGFTATVEEKEGGARRRIEARRVLLATGAVDVEPDLPDLPGAVRRGLVRYCPICDGYESRDRRIAVIGHGKRGAGEAGFIARTYSDDVTLLTLGCPMDDLEGGERERLEGQGVKIVEEPVAALDVQGDRIAALRTGGGQELRFDVLYSALGLRYRTDLGHALGAERDADGSLLVDAHNQTTAKGLYAVGDAARGLDQVVVAMGHAAVAATHVHNRCELPTEEEPDDTGRSRNG